MSDIQTWSTTAASNNATPPNGFPEGMAPSTVNDAAREVMAAVARYRSDTDGVNTSSGTNTITLSASRTMTAYAQGDLYTFKAGGTNTGATTLNVDSLGAKDVQFNGAACTGGEIVSGLMYSVVYDGTQFQLLNASSYPAIDITTLEVTNIKAKDGTAALTIANSTGVVTIASSVLTTTDINGGTIDGATIGGSSAGAGTFTTVTATTGNITTVNATTVDTTNIEVTNVKAKDGTAALTIADSTGNVVNSGTFLSGGTISSASGYSGSRTTFTGSSSAIYKAASTAVVGAGGETNINFWSTFGQFLTTGTTTYGFLADGMTLSGPGASSANQYGFFASSSLTAATNNYGFYADIAASGTSRYNFYAAGTAPSYFGGNVGIGTTSPASFLDVAGSNTGLTSDAPVNTLRFTDTDTTTAANQPIGKIEFYNSDTGNAAVGAYILSSAVGASGGGTIRFGAAADAGAVAEVARVASTGLTVTKDTAGLGYGTGTGGAVTQATSRTTGVTLNKTNGAITLVSAAGSATWQSFTVTNSTVAATDVVVLSQKSGTDLYMLEVTAVAAGSFRISFATTGGTTTEQPVFNFAVIKAVAA